MFGHRPRIDLWRTCTSVLARLGNFWGLARAHAFSYQRLMKILVTGGTGFIGSRLVRTLAERGDDVVVLSRTAGESAFGRKVAWTPDAPGPWLDEVRAADAVVHLAGAGVMDKRWSAEHLENLRTSRIGPTRLVAETLAARENKPKVFVCASAVGYYGFREDDRTCDESAASGTDALADLCREWEAATEPAKAAGIRVCNARIGVVLGPEGGALAQMLPVFKLGIGGPLGSGKQMLPWIHAEDAVRALIFALDDARVEGPFNVTAPTPVNMNAFAKELGRVLHRPSIFRVPGFVLKTVVGDGAAVVLTGQNAVPRKLESLGFSYTFPDLHGALQDAVRD